MTLLTDDFNRANGGLGSDWTAAQDTLIIVDNKVTGTTLSGVHIQASTVSGDVGTDQFAEVDITLTDNGYNRSVGPIVNCTIVGGGLASMYKPLVSTDGNLYLYFKDSVATPVNSYLGTQIGSTTHPHTTPGETVRVRMERVGDEVIVYTNGVERLRVEHTSLLTGKPGMALQTSSYGGDYVTMDAFIGGDYVPDETAPELDSANVPSAGTTIVVVFDEAVSGTEEDGWSITAAGGAVTVSSGSGSGTNTLTLTLSRTIDYGETVTISYDDGTGDLEDAAGNPLADITNFSVTNNSTVNIPVAPTMEDESVSTEMDDTNTYAILGRVTAGSPDPTFTLSGTHAALFDIVSPIVRPVYNIGTAMYDATDFDDEYEISFKEQPEPGTYHVTVEAENASGTATTDYTIEVLEASTSPVPILPQLTVNTSLPEGWDGTADVSGNLSASSLAAAFAAYAASPDSDLPYIIQLTKATSRALSLSQAKAPKHPGSRKCVVRTSGYADLPEYGDRTVPGSDSANYATIKNVGSDPALWFEDGAHDYRFIGIEFATDEATCYNLITVGRNAAADTLPTSTTQIPEKIIFDRCYAHGNTSGILRRAFAFDGKNSAIIGCHIDKCQDTATDSQAIAIANTPGRIKIYNNHLKAAGENILIGGSDPSIKFLVPSDIEITCNFFTKSLTWKVDDPSYDDVAHVVKNLLELKQGERVLIEGNVFEKCWPQGQNGQAILFTPRNQGLRANWSIVNDVTFRKNWMYDVNRLIDIYSRDAGDIFSSYGFTSRRIMRILVEDNIGIANPPDYGTTALPYSHPLCSLLCGPSPAEHVTFNHNTFDTIDDGDTGSSSAFVVGDTGTFANNFVLRNSVQNHCLSGIKGTGTGSGTIALNLFMGNWEVDHNVLYFPPDHPDPENYVGVYPPDNDVVDGEADVEFEDYRDDCSLGPASDYALAGTDGRDLGYNKTALDLAIATALSGDGEGDEPPPDGNDPTSAIVDAVQPAFYSPLEYNVMTTLLNRRRRRRPNGRQ